MQPENVFNIFIHHDSNSSVVSEYYVKCYSLVGTEEEKMTFLKSIVIEDYNTGKPYNFHVQINDEEPQHTISIVLLTHILAIMDYSLFEQAFIDFQAPKNPLVLFTHVVDGEPQITTQTKKINPNSINALISRGFDNYTARLFIIRGLNLSVLQQKKIDELKSLGLQENIISNIHKSKRPPIPEEIIVKLLYECKRTCCVCRDPSKPIIIHHIEDWALSRSHDIENLVVLCLEHHDQAHTKKELSINLDKKQLLSFKKRWLEKVKYDDSRAILNLINDTYSRWDYYNINRLFELFFEFNIDFREIKTFQLLNKLCILNDIGTINSTEIWKVQRTSERYFFDFGEGIMLNYYLKTITEKILEKLPLINLTNKLTKTDFTSLLTIGSYFTVQLGYYFTDIKESDSGETTLRKAYYKGNGIVIQFVFDAFNCSSSSAKYDHLTGHNIITPILYVKSIKKEAGKLFINCSCLAIGSYFNNDKIGRHNNLFIGDDD